jgi:hypothetical protein
MNDGKQNDLADHVLGALPREDLDIIVELVLRSGSLKDLATSYGVTYPTIRLRLDRLIERLQAAVNGKQPDPLKELLARLVERGEMSASGARSVRDLVRGLLRGQPVDNSSQKGGVS